MRRCRLTHKLVYVLDDIFRKFVPRHFCTSHRRHSPKDPGHKYLNISHEETSMHVNVNVQEPPAIVHQKRGVCFHVDMPCFTLDPPKNKKQKQESAFMTRYRIKKIAKTAQSPDMNMTLNEIRTGITRYDRMKFSFLVYILGVLAIFLTAK